MANFLQSCNRGNLSKRQTLAIACGLNNPHGQFSQGGNRALQAIADLMADCAVVGQHLAGAVEKALDLAAHNPAGGQLEGAQRLTLALASEAGVCCRVRHLVELQPAALRAALTAVVVEADKT